MAILAISRYRGGSEDEVVPLARSLKEIYARHGVGYRLGRVQGEPNAGDWVVTVSYADTAAYESAGARFAADPDLQGVFQAIARFARRMSRDVVEEVEV